MKIDRRALAGLGVTGVLLLGAAVPALARDATESPTTGEEPTAEHREARAAEREQQFAAALAEELGIDEETVAAALDTVRTRLMEERAAERRAALEERLAEAVAAGDLTQEQADALLAAEEAGVLGRGFGPRGGHGRGGFGGPGGPGGPGGFGGFGGPGATEDAPGATEDATPQGRRPRPDRDRTPPLRSAPARRRRRSAPSRRRQRTSSRWASSSRRRARTRRGSASARSRVSPGSARRS